MFLRLDEKPSDSMALVDGDGLSVTYGELRVMCDEASRYMARRSLVFVLCENAAGACAAYIAALAKGIVPLLLSRTLQTELLQGLMDAYRPAYLWMPEDCDIHGEYETLWRKWGYRLMKTGLESPPMAPELALLLPTSGSTGSPKLVRHSLENIEANAKAVAGVFALDSTSVGMISLPINFTQGLNVATSHLYAGGTALVTKATLMRREFWDFFKEQRAQSFTGVPYSYELLSKLRFFTMDLPSLKIINQGGGRMSDELFRKCADYADETGRKFIATYGSTETTSRMACLPAELAKTKTGSIGRPLPGCEIVLRDDGGAPITAPNTEGEIVFRGPNVTLGYAERAEDLMKGDERGGVYATGDMAYFDEDGCYYITGRKGRFLKLFGYRVCMDSLERMVKTEIDIPCACVGTDKCLFVYIERADAAERVLSIVAEATGLHRQAFRVCVIDSIPKNESGKTMYSALKLT